MTTDINKAQAHALRRIINEVTGVCFHDMRTVNALISRGYARMNKRKTSVTATAKGRRYIN